MILIDDGRYDNYTFTYGPSWFQTPNIKRIADEGINYKYCFPATSLCSPSRASIMTGDYPHHTGIVRNGVSDSLTIPTIATILQSNGYYTGFVGKYGFNKWPIPGYDYFLDSSNDDYWNTYYFYYKTGWQLISGHKTTVLTDSAKKFIETAPSDKPWCLFLFHKAPHSPLQPRAEDSTLYENEIMPFPSNFYKYTIDYPNYMYFCHSYSGDSSQLKNEYLKYYQLLAGVEWSTGVILNTLDSLGILDSTMVIFTSDNGLLKGEHLASGKQVALEESLRLPLLIRYPKWFTPGTLVNDQLVSLIDLAPTIIDAAGITNPVNMDGWSLHDTSKQRKEFYYEFFNKNEECTPTMHAVRSFEHVFIHNSCTFNTNEFYDLINDSLMNFNQINNPAYADLISEYIQKLDSLQKFYGDTVWVDTIVTCKLTSNFPTFDEDEDVVGTEIIIAPNPGSGTGTIFFKATEAALLNVQVFDIMGRKIDQLICKNPSNKISLPFDFGAMAKGIYLLKMQTTNEVYSFRYLKTE